jgi:hypothetical protein
MLLFVVHVVIRSGIIMMNLSSPQPWEYKDTISEW